MKIAIVCLSILLLVTICISAFEGLVIAKLNGQRYDLIGLCDAQYRRINELQVYIAGNCPCDNMTLLRYYPSIPSNNNWGYRSPIWNGYWRYLDR
jgi:hypothetical protein